MAVDARTGHVVVTTEEDGTVSLLDARRAMVLHTTRLGAAPVALAIDARTAHAFVLQAAGTAGAYGASGGQVSTVDTHTGAVVQTAAVGHAPLAIAADARAARVFVTNGGDNTVSILDARSGRVLRTVTVGWLPGALAVDTQHERVFVVNDGDGSLSVLNARSGAVLSTVTVFAAAHASALTMPYTVAVDDVRDRVYMTAWGRLGRAGLLVGRGQLAVLDALHGRVLRMVALGVAPQALAVEESSGRVVVVDGGGMIRAPQGWGQQWRVQVARWAPWLAWLTPHATQMVRVPGDVEVLDPEV